MTTPKRLLTDLEAQAGGPRVSSGKDSKQDYATPWEFIRAVEERFGERLFVDLAASGANAKALQFYTEKDNSLKQAWHKLASGILWLNPPFSDIAPWTTKCRDESQLGARILLLTPASIGTEWFANYVHGHALVLALRPRMTFEGAKDPYPKDLMLSCFGFGETGFECWKWNQPAEQQTLRL